MARCSTQIPKPPLSSPCRFGALSGPFSTLFNLSLFPMTRAARRLPPKSPTAKRALPDDFFPPESPEDDFWPPPAVEAALASAPPPAAPLAVPPPSLPATAEPDPAGLLLDHFAAQALAGILAGTLSVPNSAVVAADVAALAYRCAQAMLRERTKYLSLPTDLPF